MDNLKKISIHLFPFPESMWAQKLRANMFFNVFNWRWTYYLFDGMYFEYEGIFGWMYFGEFLICY